MYNILLESVAGKKKENPLSGREKLTILEIYDDWPNFFTRVESKTYKDGRAKKVIEWFAHGNLYFLKGPDSNHEPFKWLNILIALVRKQKS